MARFVYVCLSAHSAQRGGCIPFSTPSPTPARDRRLTRPFGNSHIPPSSPCDGRCASRTLPSLDDHTCRMDVVRYILPGRFHRTLDPARLSGAPAKFHYGADQAARISSARRSSHPGPSAPGCSRPPVPSGRCSSASCHRIFSPAGESTGSVTSKIRGIDPLDISIQRWRHPCRTPSRRSRRGYSARCPAACAVAPGHGASRRCIVRRRSLLLCANCGHGCSSQVPPRHSAPPARRHLPAPRRSGNRRIHFSKVRMTVSTRVCCSMISDTHTAYASLRVGRAREESACEVRYQVRSLEERRVDSSVHGESESRDKSSERLRDTVKSSLELKSAACRNDLVRKVLDVIEQLVLQNSPVTGIRAPGGPGQRSLATSPTWICGYDP